MTPARVIAASVDWVYVPDNATRLETDEYLLVRFPDYSEHQLELLGFEPGPDLEAAVERVLEGARTLDVAELIWWVKLGAPAGTTELVVARGGVPDETLDVLALDLAPGLPDLAAHDVEVRWAVEVDVLRDSHRVLSSVFGGEVPPPERLQVETWQTRADMAVGRGGGVVAYVDDEPVGTGGLTVAGDVARLWSGAVVQPARGRGVYRALLAARLEYAVARGCTMALVKGRIETSGPILRRAGFRAYGQERSFSVPLGSPRSAR